MSGLFKPLDDLATVGEDIVNGVTTGFSQFLVSFGAVPDNTRTLTNGPTTNKKRSTNPMTFPEACDILESLNKIKLHSSSADNAVEVLTWLLETAELSESAQAAITFSIHVHKSAEATVPVGLTKEEDTDYFKDAVVR